VFRNLSCEIIAQRPSPDLANLAQSDNEKMPVFVNERENRSATRLAMRPVSSLNYAMARKIFLICSLLAISVWCPGIGKKYNLYLVTFHLEGDQTDNPKFITPVKLGKDHRQYFFSKIPCFTDKDIAWFYPFTSRDGASFGVAFRLKDHAAIELKAITLTNQGKLLGLRCSDAQLQAVLIDRPLDDGTVVVWEGLQQRHLEEFGKRFPHVDDFVPRGGPQFATPD